MKKRQTFAIADQLLHELAEFRWRHRIPSLSRALELILRAALMEKRQPEPLQEREDVQREREMNNEAYRKAKATFRPENQGDFVVIALGELQGYAHTLSEAFSLLKSRAPRAKHAILDRVGEAVEVEATWEGFAEKLR